MVIHALPFLFSQFSGYFISFCISFIQRCSFRFIYISRHPCYNLFGQHLDLCTFQLLCNRMECDLIMKKIMASLFCVLLLLLTACHSAPSFPTAPDSGKDDSPLSAEAQTLEPFSSVEIDVLAADISVIPGEEWSISYNLSEKEPLKRFGVEQGTLYVETTFDPSEHFEHKDWFITVTVPADASFYEIDLDTISGSVELRGIACDSASLSSTSGKVEAQDIRARELEMDATSEKITAANVSCDSFEAETVSSDVQAEGIFGEMEVSTVSGNAAVTGSISLKGELESVSGNISLELNHSASMQASSRGTILLNGTKMDAPITSGSGIPITIRSVSGDLTIKTA